MKLHILGSGTCALSISRGTACYVLEIDGEPLVFDLGNGALYRLMEGGFDYGKLRHFHFTHTHPDHISDLMVLIEALNYTPGLDREDTLHITGPQEVMEFLDTQIALHGPLFKPHGYGIRRYPLTAGSGYETEGWKVKAFQMNHPATLGYRIESQGKVFCYSGDSTYCEEVVALCKEADIAVLDSSHPRRVAMMGHMSAYECGLAAKRAGVLKLVLSHFYPLFKPGEAVDEARSAGFQGEIVEAQDQLVIPI